MPVHQCILIRDWSCPPLIQTGMLTYCACHTEHTDRMRYRSLQIPYSPSCLHSCRKRDASKQDMEFTVPAKSRKTTHGGNSVLDLDTAGFYRPRTKETRAAYETLLNTIHGLFGDQPQDILRGAADEVLAVLKNQNLTDPQRQKETQELLGPVDNVRFAELVSLGKLITDYVGEGEEVAAGDTLDQDIGVAVEVSGWPIWPSTVHQTCFGVDRFMNNHRKE